MRSLPIRLRLTFWYFGLFALAAVLLSSASWFLLKQSLDSLLLHELDERIDDVQSLLEAQSENARPEELRALLLHDYRLKDEGKWLQILDEQGNWLYYSSRPAIASPLLRYPEGTATVSPFRTNAPHQLTTLTRRLSVRGRVFVVSMAISADQSVLILRRFRRDLFLLVPIGLLMAACAGHLLSRKALRPVAAIAKEARRINDRNLELRLPVPDTRDELAHLSETLNQMLERIEGAFRSVRAFTANASHELRTPLSLIRTRVEIALCFPRTADFYEKTLEEIQEETVGMTLLIENLLSLARADAQAEPPRLAMVDMNELICRTGKEWADIAQKLSLTFHVRTSNIPLWVLGEEIALQRLVRILVDNAFCYTDAGGTITMRTEIQGEMAIISIQDTGHGIAPEQLPFIFDRFYRGVKSASLHPGSGLGLALAKWIAEQHKAEISVQSEPEKGSCFSVRMKLCDALSPDL